MLGHCDTHSTTSTALLVSSARPESTAFSHCGRPAYRLESANPGLPSLTASWDAKKARGLAFETTSRLLDKLRTCCQCDCERAAARGFRTSSGTHLPVREHSKSMQCHALVFVYFLPTWLELFADVIADHATLQDASHSVT